MRTVSPPLHSTHILAKHAPPVVVSCYQENKESEGRFLYLHAALDVEALKQDQDYGDRPDFRVERGKGEMSSNKSSNQECNYNEEIRNQASNDVRLDFFLFGNHVAGSWIPCTDGLLKGQSKLKAKADQSQLETKSPAESPMEG